VIEVESIIKSEAILFKLFVIQHLIVHSVRKYSHRILGKVDLRSSECLSFLAVFYSLHIYSFYQLNKKKELKCN